MIDMIVKVHIVEQNKKMVAICDSDLLGKKFEEGKLQLDLTSDFYKGMERSEEDIVKILKGAYIVNLVGKESVALGKKLGIIEEGYVRTISGVPLAQAVLAVD